MLIVVPEVDVNSRDVNQSLLMRRRRKNQLCLCTTDGVRELLSVDRQKSILVRNVVRLVNQYLIVKCLITFKCRNRLHLSELGIWARLAGAEGTDCNPQWMARQSVIATVTSIHETAQPL